MQEKIIPTTQTTDEVIQFFVFRALGQKILNNHDLHYLDIAEFNFMNEIYINEDE